MTLLLFKIITLEGNTLFHTPNIASMNVTHTLITHWVSHTPLHSMPHDSLGVRSFVYPKSRSMLSFCFKPLLKS